MKWISLLCGLSKMTSFRFSASALIWICLAFENDLFSASGSKLAGSSCRSIEIDLMSMIRSRFNWVFVCGIENDSILASGTNMLCFLCRDHNRLRFCVQAEKYLVLV